jgi:hypothetical protein
MNCKEVSQKLPLFLDGELSISEMDAMNKHFNLCPYCESKSKDEMAFKTSVKGIRRHTAQHTMMNDVVSFVYQNNRA